MLHLAVLERIIVAILGVVAAFLPGYDQGQRGASRLLHGHIGHVRAYEPVRGGVHFKHGRGGVVVVDVLVHRDRISMAGAVTESESSDTAVAGGIDQTNDSIPIPSSYLLSGCTLGNTHLGWPPLPPLPGFSFSP